MSEEHYDANIFLSYRHEDNDYLKGAIVEFAKNLVRAYEFQTGKRLHLFIDENIQWGARWQEVLDRNISQANILLVAVTPMYLKSDACRKELLDFNSCAKTKQGNEILSLIWQGINDLDGGKQDLVRNIIQERQFISVKKLVFWTSDMIEYQKEVSAIAAKLCDVVKEQNRRIDNVGNVLVVQHDNVEEDDGVKEDLISLMIKAEQYSVGLNEAVSDLTNSLNNILGRFNRNDSLNYDSASDLKRWADRIVSDSQNDVRTINHSLSLASGTWKYYYTAMLLYVDQISAMPPCALRDEQIETMANAVNQLASSFSLPDETQQLFSILNVLEKLVSQLSPVTSSVNNMIKCYSDIRNQAISLRDMVEKLRH